MDQNISPKKENAMLIIGLLIIAVLGFGTSFISGFFVSRMLSGEKNVTTTQLENFKPIQIPKTESQGEIVAPGDGVSQESTKFIPGKFYYDDTIIMVSKSEPHRNIVATVTRVQQDEGYVQNTRVSFYDGSEWRRRVTSQKVGDSAIVSNSIVKSWSIDIEPSRVLKQSVRGDLQIDNSQLSFSSGLLHNELGIRSLPGYTKFMSQGTGTLTVEGAEYEAYVLYTRVYSQNAADLQFYNQPFGVTTDWLAFWDEEDNFYHIDVTNVDKPTPTYQTHQIGIFETRDMQVSKTFSVEVERDELVPPRDYKIQMKDPLNMTISLQRVNELNKDVSGSFTWYMGNVDGKVERDGKFIPGVGLIEYIYN